MHLPDVPQAGTQGGAVRSPGRPPPGLCRAGTEAAPGNRPGPGDHGRDALLQPARSVRRGGLPGLAPAATAEGPLGTFGPGAAIADVDIQLPGGGAWGLSRPDCRAGRPRL